MSKKELLDILKNITYKPDFVHEAIFQPNDIIILVLTTIVSSVDDSNKKILISKSYSFTGSALLFATEEEIVHKIRDCYLDLERHEFNEWFKFKGVCVVDPHPKHKKDMLHV